MHLTTDPATFDKAKNIKIVIFDIDGVMTQGQIQYASDGKELKSFNVQDGLGIKLLQKAGITCAIITGRSSEVVARRARELNITHLIQGRDDKLIAANELLNELKFSTQELAYMGDDLPDLSIIQSASLGLCPNNAVEAVKQHADYICEKRGGDGAVREVSELILQAQDKLDALIAQYTL